MAFAHYEYTVRSGDSLSRIVYDTYGWTQANQPTTYGATLKGVLAMNPHITDPDRIYAGQILRLPSDPTSASLRHVRPAILQQQGFVTDAIPSSEREQVSMLIQLARNTNWLTVPGGVALGTASGLLGSGNQQLLSDIGNLYAEYKAGKISKGQYDGRRAKKIEEIRRNLGPLEKAVHRSGTRNALRGRLNALPSDLTRIEAERWKRIARHARTGGIVLAGVGATAACVQIAHTLDSREKNEIFVDTVASTIAGFAVGLFMVSNPIGWGTVLVIAIGGAVASYSAGKIASSAYSAWDNPVDFVTGTGLDRICR